MKTQYKANGLVYGRYWGGGEGAYPAEKYHADTIEKLEKDIRAGIENGSIDSGMGYESVLGAVMDIETIETIEKDGKEYRNSSFETKSYGNLTDEQIEFCENNLYY